MAPNGDFELERLELKRLLASGIFHRAPNLALVLNYVCSKYFEGGAEQIKEYNIAVEALGRPAEFDQKADSIVRVEAHRLRKRLREYYESEGAGHNVHIEIPPGQYAPRFIIRHSPENSRPAPELEPLPEAPEPPEPPEGSMALPEPHAPRSGRRVLWIGGVIVLVAAAAVPLKLWRHEAPRPAATILTPAPAPAPAPSGDAIRIMCGLEHGSYTDHYGNIWQHDQYSQGGTIFDSGNHTIRETRDPRLYNLRREGAFRYDIPLQRGVYELRLHFAETVYGDNNAAGGGETSRVFNIYINGQEVLHEFDVVADGGASTADVKVFKDISPAPDGKLHLLFETHSNPPILNGIEIFPGLPGRMRPLRMLAQDRTYIDKDGRSWEPDHYAVGGQLVTRGDPVSGASDPDLYRGERFGNFSYVIPVAQGSYGITLYFAETWFGPNQAGSGGAGSRVFDILCNGVAVRRNFDIFKEAGGPGRAITWTFHNVQPSHQGKLVVSLVPVKNYASINAIEVVDESR